jgi:hypothetical protein
MSLIPWPAIADVIDGQVLSAAQLNSYKEAVEHLLAHRHGPNGVVATKKGVHTLTNDYETLWQGYMYHSTLLLAYTVGLTWAGAGGCQWRLCYRGDDTALHTAYQNDETVTGIHSGTVALAGTSMTLGKVYEWYLRVESDAATPVVTGNVWRLCEQDNVAAEWVAPPTFVNGLSDDGDLNALKTDCDALHAHMISKVNPFFIVEDEVTYNNGSMAPVAYGRFRYHPNHIYIQISGRMKVGTSWTWRPTIEYQDGSTEALAESAPITSGDDFKWDQASFDISGLATPLVEGTDYRVEVEVDTGSDDLEVKEVLILYGQGAGVPAAGWEVPVLFAEGNTNLSAANMNKYSTDLLMLYTAGGEMLWGENHAIQYNSEDHADSFNGTSFKRMFGGAHQKKYFVYRHEAVAGDITDGPRLNYGEGHDYHVDLPTGEDFDPSPDNATLSLSEWLVYDLSQLPMLAFGTLYSAEHCFIAFESDVAIT